MSNKSRNKHIAVCLFFLIFLVVFGSHINIIQQFEQASLDFRFVHFNRNHKASDRVVVVDIDEQSIKLLSSSYGRWPWPRRIYKELIEFLSIGEPAAIIFDLLFTEKTIGSDDDRQLAEISKTTGIVSHALNLLEDPATEGDNIIPLAKEYQDRFGIHFTGETIADTQQTKKYRDYLLPAEDYMKLIPKVHIVVFNKDSDGTYRRAHMLFNYNGTWIPSLSLSAILSIFKKPILNYHEGSLDISEESTLKLRIPLDQNGDFTLNFYNPSNSPQSIPIAAAIASAIVLQKGEVSDPNELKVNPLQLKDKIILIGASAAGLEDLKATPVHPAYPGVQLHATAISNILENDHLYRLPAPWRAMINIALIFLAYFFVLSWDRIYLKVLLPVLSLCGYSIIAIYCFKEQNLWIDIAVPYFSNFLVLLDGLAYTSFIEGLEKRKLKGTLSKYLSPSVMEKVIAQGANPQAEVGQRIELSILFSDIRSFTTMTESMEAEQIVQHLNAYLGCMTNIIFNHTGTLDKFIGDAIMAFWGAPLPDSTHATHATDCASDMIAALDDLNKNWKEKNELPMRIGIGINTGEVIVGNIGSEKRLDYTVIGDNVNLASRLEGLTKQYHVNIIIGEMTKNYIDKSTSCRLLDFVQVKGKQKHVRIYEPLGLKTDRVANELVDRFHVAFETYQSGDFQKALHVFEDIRLWRPGGDGPSQVYIERCQQLIKTPPKNWDGIFVATSK